MKFQRYLDDGCQSRLTDGWHPSWPPLSRVGEIIPSWNASYLCYNERVTGDMTAGLIVFTDLDGTFLDPDTYSCEASLPAFRKLKERGVPVIPVTSKTRVEVEELMEFLDWTDPFIVENGAAVFVPGEMLREQPDDTVEREPYYVKILGVTYGVIRSFLVTKQATFGITGFFDMTVRRVSELSGLTLEQASRAMAREFTEPFLIEREAETFVSVAEREGFKVTRGGRFYHLTGPGQDKGTAARWLIHLYETLPGYESVVSMGLGDSYNDLPLLAEVDHPVFVGEPVEEILNSFNPGQLHVSELKGPTGWNRAVMELIPTMSLKISGGPSHE